MDDFNGVVVVDGVDLYERFGLILADGYEIGIPEYKRFTKKLLGDGVVDITEAAGDVYFEERKIKLPMFASGPCTVEEYELLKSEVASWVNGRRCEMRFSIDPGFTYTGRVSSSSFKWDAKVFTCTLTVDAEPYKTLGRVVFRANAAGGVKLRLDNGRARTQPTVEVYNKAVMSFEDKHWELDPGTWVLDDFWLHSGENVVSVTTTPDYGDALLSDYENTELADIADKLLCDLAAGDEPLQVPMTMAEVDAMCSDLMTDGSGGTDPMRGVLFAIDDVRLVDLAYPASEDAAEFGDTNIYFEYEWRDL